MKLWSLKQSWSVIKDYDEELEFIINFYEDEFELLKGAPKKVHVFHSQTTNQVMALTQPDIQYFSSEYSKVFSSSDIIVKPMQWIVNHSV